MFENLLTNIMHRKMYQRIVCADGTSVSIQAGAGTYCEPRNNAGPYTHVEAGFPDGRVPESWLAYADTPDTPSDTVYAYLPYALVDAFIALHGGIVSGELPERAR